MNYFLIFATWL